MGFNQIRKNEYLEAQEVLNRAKVSGILLQCLLMCTVSDCGSKLPAASGSRVDAMIVAVFYNRLSGTRLAFEYCRLYGSAVCHQEAVILTLAP